LPRSRRTCRRSRRRSGAAHRGTPAAGPTRGGLRACVGAARGECRARTVSRGPRGLGHLAGWSAEVALPVHGTFTTPAKGSLRADAVLTAPEDGIAVLFVEVDNHSEQAVTVARKVADYRQFFRR
jgi:hypothetical protein